MEFLKTTGRLVYEPDRGQDFKKAYKQRTLVAELPWDDLDLYYQWFLRKRYGEYPRLARPMFGKHVTIVRGDERGFTSPNWKKHEGETLDIYYVPDLELTFKFWSLPVKGDGLFELRRELGLTAFHDFHITIARQDAQQ